MESINYTNLDTSGIVRKLKSLAKKNNIKCKIQSRMKALVAIQFKEDDKIAFDFFKSIKFYRTTEYHSLLCIELRGYIYEPQRQSILDMMLLDREFYDSCNSNRQSTTGRK